MDIPVSYNSYRSVHAFGGIQAERRVRAATHDGHASFGSCGSEGIDTIAGDCGGWKRNHGG